MHKTGPDKQAAELNKWLSTLKRNTILDILNLMWETETLEKSLEDADIVPIYKKGNATDPANYRPIALLNAIYKLYAAMIKIRLAEGLEPKIWGTQYGCRKTKSTAQALFIARRIQDLGLEHNYQAYLTLLDWEKAFDKKKLKA